MYWCPICKKQYIEGIDVCPDCNGKLVIEPKVPDGNTSYDHEAYLITVSGEMEANIIETLLTSNNIPVLRKYREAGAYLNIYMGNSTAGIDIYIPSEFYNIARELVEQGNEADPEEENIQSDEKDLLIIEEKKLQQKRSIRAWIILLFFIPGPAIAFIYFLIMLLTSLFK